MQTVLVTLREPRRSIDLEVPGDTSISELVPLLQEALAAAPAGGDDTALDRSDLWSAATTPLPPDRTFVHCGVVDGTILLLQDAQLLVLYTQSTAPLPLI